MRRLILATLTAAGALAALVSSPGCNGGGGGSKGGGGNGPATWGVMAYVLGRQENSQGALNALTQLQNSNAKANIIIETAFSTIDVSAPPFTTTREITAAGGTGTTRSDRGAIPMTDSTECGRYLTDAFHYTNAQRHLLIVHGHHGGPAFGVGADTLATVSSFDLAGLDAAITTARTASNNAKLDIIVLDMPESATFE